MLLLTLLACFDDQPIVAATPTLSFLEMPCDYAESAKIDAPEYTLPTGAVVVSVEECFTDGELEVCQNANWLRASNGFVVGNCIEGSRATTVVVNYLE